MHAFQYSPNRTSRVLDVEIDTRQRSPGIWDADCMVYEDIAGQRLFRGAGVALRGITAKTEDDLLDEVEVRIADDIEHERGVKL